MSVDQQMVWLRERLAAAGSAVLDASDLFAAQPEIEAKNCLFLALLELGR